MLAIKHLTQVSAWSLDKGLIRDSNEDNLSITEVLQTIEDREQLVGIYAVADGIAGMAHGERASRLAVQVANQVILQDLQSNDTSSEAVQASLTNAMQTAHRMVQTVNEKMPSYECSGTTLILAVVIDHWLHIANIGDSRAYIVTGDEIRQISEDHTFAAALVKAGAISAKDMPKSPYRNVLSQALGMSDAIKPMLSSEILSAGDYLLLCSDGLYSQINDETIERIVRNAPSPSSACQMLTAAANAAGGQDNISVILVEMHEAD